MVNTIHRREKQRVSSKQVQDADITHIPTIPQLALWQHESSDYQAESSLSSLSLVVSEIPTAAPDKHLQKSEALTLNRLERIRWWLLYPGRIEFVLWIGGTLLLLGVTFFLVLVSVLSLDWFGLDRTSGNSNTMSNIEITPLDNGPLVTGNLIYLRGQGFSPYGRVSFTHDTHWPCQPDAMQANGEGTFIVAIILGNGPGWEPGHHQIVVSDVISKRSISFVFMLLPDSAGKSVGAIASPSVAATPTPGSNQGSTPPPVSSSTVIPQVSPTPLPTQVAPTPLPTMGSTPTVGTTATISTPTVSVTATSHITEGQVLPLKSAESIPFGGWLWIVIVSYSIAMGMLGIVGLLHRRNRMSRH